MAYMVRLGIWGPGSPFRDAIQRCCREISRHLSENSLQTRLVPGQLPIAPIPVQFAIPDFGGIDLAPGTNTDMRIKTEARCRGQREPEGGFTQPCLCLLTYLMYVVLWNNLRFKGGSTVEILAEMSHDITE